MPSENASPPPVAGADHRRLFSAAAERNREPILAVLRRYLPTQGLVLEIASGSGQHVVHFAAALPGLQWQPSDADAAARDSIGAWIAWSGLPNVRPPLELDVRSRPWPLARADAVLSINMIHIAPWEATLALFAGAREITSTGAILVLYGPFRLVERPTAASNERFDEQLRAQDPRWGLRDLATVTDVARTAGFDRAAVIDMPANNLTVVLRKIEPHDNA